jgi:hypothetical protein
MPLESLDMAFNSIRTFHLNFQCDYCYGILNHWIIRTNFMQTDVMDSFRMEQMVLIS